jgi:hypothetical protein
MRKDAKELEFVVVTNVRDSRNLSKIIYTKGDTVQLMCSREGNILDRVTRMAARDGYLKPAEAKKAAKKTRAADGGGE